MASGLDSPEITLQDWLRSAPFNLTLSAGFFGFYAHAGCVAALEENGLYPARITGSSAGALVGSLWASGRDVQDLRSALFDLQKADFWDPGFGLGLLRGKKLSDVLDRILNVANFSDCRWPLALSVFDLKGMRTQVLAAGPLNPAIRASCAFPGLFQPVKVDGTWAIDGGVLDLSGLAGMVGCTRILYHHLLSRSRVRSRIPRLSGIPRSPDIYPIVLEDLPRVSPNRLACGPQAYEIARERMLRRLETPVHSVE